MKYMICVLLTLLSFNMFAVIRTVDNNNPSAGQYLTIQAAIDAASNDDIIYVYPSNTAYAGFNVNKRLGIYGVGWIDDYSDNYLIRQTTIAGNVAFQSGAEFAILSGFTGTFSVEFRGALGNITIENCQLQFLSFYYSQTTSANASNYVIKGNVFPGSGNGVEWINWSNELTGMLISNCLFLGSASVTKFASSNVSILNSIILTTRAVFSNHNSNPTIRNNYIVAPSYTGTNTFPSDDVIAYNMSSTALFPTGTTNQNSNPLSSVFDSQYHPILGSPAINAGDPASDFNDLDGSRNDIGVFGGPYPYDDKGYTTLPTITDINGTLYTSPSQGLQIHVEASSRH